MKVTLFTRYPRLREVAGVVLLAAALFYAVALVTYRPTDPSWNTATGAPAQNQFGVRGAVLADLTLQALGLAGWILPLLGVALGWTWLRNRQVLLPWLRVAGYTTLTLGAATALALADPPRIHADAYPAGGVLGGVLATSLVDQFNTLGTSLLLGLAFLLSLYMVSSFSIALASEGAGAWWRARARTAQEVEWEAAAEPAQPAEVEEEPKRRRKRGEQALAAAAGSAYSEPAPDYASAQEARGFLYEDELPEQPLNGVHDPVPWSEEDIPIRPLEALDPTAAEAAPPAPRAARQEPVHTNYRLPDTTLLNPAPEREGFDSQELKEIAGKIKARLEEFNVYGNVVQINPGPVVTTFEFKPDAGVKISRITTLSEDLCLGLQAESILIERIPGKPTVGIEVPNTRREQISLRQILESAEFAETPSRLTVALGKDISGRIRVTELEKMPHLLIAGSTGSGKSVMLNTLIMSVLYKSTPGEVRLILIDPKRVELGIYEGVPHLLTPVITDPKKATNALRNAVAEMERRLKLLAGHSVRNIDQFNKKVRQLQQKPLALFPEAEAAGAPELQPLPYILVVIDELADLMMIERTGVEESIIRLAQMARASGIHLVLATQRPSVDVITGLIKANFPARISFRVATRVDSRTVLDVMGAEHLLGRGDMLHLPPGSSRLSRVHGAYVTEPEISTVVEFWRAQAQPDYDTTFLQAPPADGEEQEEDEFEGQEDQLYRDAVRVVLEMGKASTSILQRRLRLGYGRAARILDMMQRDGIIGPPDGSRPREVLKRPDWLDEIETSLR